MEEQKRSLSEFAIVSFILGILSFVHFFGLEKAILAMIFGVLALDRIEKNSQLKGKKFAVIGIILSSIAVLFTALLIFKISPQLQKTYQELYQQIKNR